MLNLKLKLKIQKEISILSKSILLKKKKHKKESISTLRKLVNQQNKLGVKCLKKKNSNLLYLQNLEIKKINPKKVMHQKAKAEINQSLLMFLLKEENLKKDPSLPLIKTKKAKNQLFKKIQSLRRDLDHLPIKSLNLLKVLSYLLIRMLNLKKVKSLPLIRRLNLKKVQSLLLIIWLNLKKVRSPLLIKKVNLKKVPSLLLIKKLGHKRDQNHLMTKREKLSKLKNQPMVKKQNLKMVLSLLAQNKANLKKVLHQGKLTIAKKAKMSAWNLLKKAIVSLNKSQSVGIKTKALKNHLKMKILEKHLKSINQNQLSTFQ